ncbi:MAG TPA: DUF3048 domain-containing protein [Acidimicrobiales bacterium]|nr:DUF3048 domain-containing protein [Acidimicrobiales bacterium]
MPDPQPPPAPESGAPSDRDAGAAAEPAILTRQELRKQGGARNGGGSRAWWYVLGTGAVMVVGVGVAVLVTQGNNDTAATIRAAPVTAAPAAAPPCPLTGAPAPAGSVPARPALGIKIGNYSGDRPSAGLNQADIVFEEPVEGGITRLVSVFQCQGAPLVGDLRSARQPDVGILSQLSNPLFVHAGGINPVINLLSESPLIDKNLYQGGNASAIIQQPGRVSPYSTFVNTASLWALDPSNTTPPAPIFQYSGALPTGSVPGSGASVHIPFSGSSDVTWQWSPAAGKYLRLYSGVPDKLLDGSQTTATNVVILTVQTSYGSWVENAGGGHEVVVTATGTGPLVVMRNGVAITGTWSRSTLTQPATLTAADGAPITLQPGNTWEELVPEAVAVTPVAAPASAPTASSAGSGAVNRAG